MGQLANRLYPIDQYKQLNFGRAAKGDHGIQCSPHRSTGKQHIVNQYYLLAFTMKGILTTGFYRDFPPSEVIAMKSSIEIPDGMLLISFSSFL